MLSEYVGLEHFRETLVGRRLLKAARNSLVWASSRRIDIPLAFVLALTLYVACRSRASSGPCGSRRC